MHRIFLIIHFQQCILGRLAIPCKKRTISFSTKSWTSKINWKFNNFEEDCEVSLRSSNQHSSDESVKWFQPWIEPVKQSLRTWLQGYIEVCLPLVRYKTASFSIILFSAPPHTILRPIRRGHMGQCKCVSWSVADGCEMMLAGFATGHVAVWDLQSKSRLLTAEENGKSRGRVLRMRTDEMQHVVIIQNQIPSLYSHNYAKEWWDPSVRLSTGQHSSEETSQRWPHCVRFYRPGIRTHDPAPMAVS